MADKEKEKAERGVDSVSDYVEDTDIGDEERVKASLSGLQQVAIEAVQR